VGRLAQNGRVETSSLPERKRGEKVVVVNSHTWSLFLGFTLRLSISSIVSSKDVRHLDLPDSRSLSDDPEILVALAFCRQIETQSRVGVMMKGRVA
jgi:hypothetical protein